MTLTIGSICFGVLIGYITYRTLILTVARTTVSDLTAVVAAVGGGAVTAVITPQTDSFGWYAIGLLAGFAGYGLLYWRLNGTAEFAKVMGGRPGRPGHPASPASPISPTRPSGPGAPSPSCAAGVPRRPGHRQLTSGGGLKWR